MQKIGSQIQANMKFILIISYVKVYFLLLKCILPKLNRRIIKSASSIQLPISSLNEDKKGLPDKHYLESSNREYFLGRVKIISLLLVMSHTKLAELIF